MTRLLLCSCADTMDPDREAIAAATGLDCPKRYSALCTSQSGDAAEAMAQGDVVIACGQEARVFQEIAASGNHADPVMIDIRDRCGWSDSGADTARIAALLAEGMIAPHQVPGRDITVDGLCLVLGTAEIAIGAAEALAETLSITCLLSEAPDDLMEHPRAFDIVAGRVVSATGSFGRFSLTLAGLQQTLPAGRGPVAFSNPVPTTQSQCEIIVDLTGGAALFPAHEKREGYLRADPGDPKAVARCLIEAAQLTGTFEKPLHIRFEEALCAHSRAGQPACQRCQDICPTGAITPAGDHVSIDPMICAGCGACAAVCPTGAATLDDPGATHTMRRIAALASTYREAGGTRARLLVHDLEHGAEMIRLSARHGRGLPAGVLPLSLRVLAAFGHSEAIFALSAGIAAVDILISPGADFETVSAELELADAVLGPLGFAGRVRPIHPGDPEALEDALRTETPAGPAAEPVLPMGHRRDISRLAARSLSTTDPRPVIPLPASAPYGRVEIDTDACTLCLACASLCPPGALGDNPDRPELRFKEDACVQCGLCANVCPEDAISLVPQLNLADDALNEVILNAEEPYECISCGTPFGVKSTIERIVAQLENKHALFTNSDNAKLIRMCDNCRVKAQFHDGQAPFQMGTPRKVRTTDDYLNNRDLDD